MSLEKLKRYSVPNKITKAIMDFVRALRERYDDVEVYLFGSYARGTWIEDSDIDVIVVSKYFNGMSLEERVRILRMLADKSIPFQIFAYTPNEFRRVLRRSAILQDAQEYWIKL